MKKASNQKRTPNSMLIRAREELDLTREEVASKIGVNPRTYYRWEQGLQKPSLYDFRRLCDFLHKEPEELGYTLDAEGNWNQSNY